MALITYNATINKKPKFNFSGYYKFNKETLRLNIEWREKNGRDLTNKKQEAKIEYALRNWSILLLADEK